MMNQLKAGVVLSGGSEVDRKRSEAACFGPFPPYPSQSARQAASGCLPPIHAQGPSLKRSEAACLVLPFPTFFPTLMHRQ
eukprot:scaffold61937_cov21-Tisochrysis_lutea.AAC.1